jgi:hypothetical protein
MLSPYPPPVTSEASTELAPALFLRSIAIARSSRYIPIIPASSSAYITVSSKTAPWPSFTVNSPTAALNLKADAPSNLCFLF